MLDYGFIRLPLRPQELKRAAAFFYPALPSDAGLAVTWDFRPGAFVAGLPLTGAGFTLAHIVPAPSAARRFFRARPREGEGASTPSVAIVSIRPCSVSINSIIAMILLSLLDVNSDKYVMRDW
jgi:hypothetical protein